MGGDLAREYLLFDLIRLQLLVKEVFMLFQKADAAKRATRTPVKPHFSSESFGVKVVKQEFPLRNED